MDHCGLKNYTLDYLGCNIDVFKKHIESQFTTEMNWDNFGGYWVIDHIKPLGYNQPTEIEKIMRCNYKNTQPMTKSENYLKNNQFRPCDAEKEDVMNKRIILRCVKK